MNTGFDFFASSCHPFFYSNLPLCSSLYSGGTACTEADEWLLTGCWGVKSNDSVTAWGFLLGSAGAWRK